MVPTSSPAIVALGYYDGATEGMASSIGDLGSHYFKVSAWDATQDERLYVGAKLDATTQQRLIALLSKRQTRSSTPVWIPGWIFKTPDDEREAQDIVDTCRASLCSATLLAMGRRVDMPDRLIVEIPATIDADLKRAIRAAEPEDLSSWLQKLSA